MDTPRARKNVTNEAQTVVKQHFNVRGHFILIAIVSLLALSGCRFSSRPSPQAKQGVLDLRDWDFQKDGLAQLHGQWYVSWRKLLTPKDFQGKRPHHKTFFSIPSFWNNAQIAKDKKMGSFGYATFFLRVHLPTQARSLPQGLGLLSPNQRTANRLWILDESGHPLTAPLHNGIVGTTKSTHIPQLKPEQTQFRPKQHKTLWLVLQVSNFQHTNAGPYKAPSLGDARQLIAYQRYHRQLTFFLLGMIAFMAFYHLLLFSYRTADKAPLWFSGFCGTMILRIELTSNHLYGVFSSQGMWDFLLRLEHITVFVACSFAGLFVQSIFSQEIRKKWALYFAWFGVAFTVTTLLTPIPLYTRLVFFYQPFLLLFILYIIVKLTRTYFRSRDSIALWLLGGFFVGSITVFHDLLHHRNWITSAYLSQYGLLVFMVSQAIVLAIVNQRTREAIEIFAERLEQQSNAARRFVPHSFLELLGKESLTDIQLGDHTQRQMSILFSDIRSFTSLSEKLSPQENFHFINEYLSYMDAVVQNNEGFVDKYIGDAVMALFDAEADHALQAALGMLKALDEFNQLREEKGGEVIRIGIGINSGDVMLGTIGGHYRMDGTVISDAVNLASRVESMTKLYKTQILITEHTYQLLRDPSLYHIREIDRVVVKGKVKPVTVYEVYDHDSPVLIELKDAHKKEFSKGLRYYRDRKFTRAVQIFSQCLGEAPEQDEAAYMYIQRCKEHQAMDLTETWNGVLKM